MKPTFIKNDSTLTHRSRWIDIRLRDVELTLLPERAVFSTEHSALFIADTHFGKDATFRKSGLPVPAGGCKAVLDKLLELIKRTGAKQLIILGDMFHARSSLADDVLMEVNAFLQCIPNTNVKLVRGNHDRSVGKLPPDWNLEVIEPGFRIGRLVLTHEPQPLVGADEIVLCGHLHPAVRLSGRGNDIGKLPCFWWTRGNLVLPALGKFTGSMVIEPIENDKVWIVAGDQLVPRT